MMGLPPTVKVYICVNPVDFRRQHDGLSSCVRHILSANPMSGHLFVFTNKRGNGIKILFWDRNGFALFYKKLCRGTFKFPQSIEPTASSVQIESPELALILEGIDLKGAKRRGRWEPDEKLAPMPIVHDRDSEK